MSNTKQRIKISVKRIKLSKIILLLSEFWLKNINLLREIMNASRIIQNKSTQSNIGEVKFSTLRNTLLRRQEVTTSKQKA